MVGWPVRVLRRGATVMRAGEILAAPGSGVCLPRAPYGFIAPRGVVPDGFGMAG